jgi:hypothetical protein
MSVVPDHAAELGRARMLFSLLAAPKLRRGLGQLLAGDTAATDHSTEQPPADGPSAKQPSAEKRSAEPPSTDGPLSRLDWLGSDGAVDVPALRRISESLALMRSDQAILEVPRLAGIPVKTEESREVSGRIARLVFERVGRERRLSEPELNAAIAMFAADVALVRRDAVDAAVLERSADGSEYRLAP